MLTATDVQLMLDIIREAHGPGYADDAQISQLQAKLSIMLEAKLRVKGVNNE